MNGPPLVSVAIPAYNEKYFEEALASALAQDYENLEVVVCDDSPGTTIQAICHRHACDRLYYTRNPGTLGVAGNFTKCFGRAQGDYVKFLNDDDVLAPHCVSTMVAEFERRGPGVTLVTSKRQIIDHRGHPMPDVGPTIALTPVTKRLNGLELGNFVLVSATNFIGEPTTVMFRHADVQLEDASLFNFFGRDYILLADLSLWLRLLSKGDAVYVAEPLSRFRIHEGQEQFKPCHSSRVFTERLHILDGAAQLGFLSNPAEMDEALKTLVDLLALMRRDPRVGPADRELLDAAEGLLSQRQRITR